jgi:cleavage and polyadenylation specificity factor subunit 1
MADCTACLDGCQVFSKIDLQKGYLQVPVAAEDVAKTAVVTPFSLFKFIRMRFGLKNVGMTFHCMMDRIFADIPFTFILLDDILVASRTAEEHQQHLQAVLGLLQENGLLINAVKCVWGAAEVEFLGHTVSAAGTAPLKQRVAAIQAHPRPHTVRDVQAFLGLFNFYR